MYYTFILLQGQGRQRCSG